MTTEDAAASFLAHVCEHERKTGVPVRTNEAYIEQALIFNTGRAVQFDPFELMARVRSMRAKRGATTRKTNAAEVEAEALKASQMGLKF